MAVRLRLKRFGRTHHAVYRLGAFDSRTPRDGRVLEELGTYAPCNKNKDEQLQLEADRIEEWLDKGALPTETVRSLLRKQGIGKGKI